LYTSAYQADEYKSLKETATIKDLQDYIEANSDSPHTADAMATIEALKEDMAPYNAVIAKGITEESLHQFQTDYPGHIMTGSLKEKLVEVSAFFEGNIHDLLADDKITVSIKGNNIQNSTIKITNKSKSEINVIVPFGTWLKSSSSSVQNMLVTYESEYYVKPGESYEGKIYTACMNMRRNIPSESNTMTLNYYGDSHKLNKLIKLLKAEKASYTVIQAAVWIVTDDATDYELTSILVDSSGKSD